MGMRAMPITKEENERRKKMPYIVAGSIIVLAAILISLKKK